MYGLLAPTATNRYIKRSPGLPAGMAVQGSRRMSCSGCLSTGTARCASIHSTPRQVRRARARGWQSPTMQLSVPGWSALASLLSEQDGVVARRQLSAAGASPDDLARMLRRRELTRVHPGIYVTHTGPLTPRQREWVAVLAAWPAALDGDSALAVRASSSIVRVAVSHHRTLVLPPGVRMRRVTNLQERVAWQRKPPRMRAEEALIDEMADRLCRGEVDRAFAILAEVITDRRTTVERVLLRLRLRGRVGQRRLLEAMLTDVRDGLCSVLERGYRDRVERPHGLPRGARQRASRATGTLTLQDVRYDDVGVIVELDGTLGHTSTADRDADALRDLSELAGSSRVTARLTYGLVFRHGCRTAMHIGEILRGRGWRGRLRRCPRCPPR